MSSPGLDLVDVKFFNDVGREILELNGRVALLVLRSGDELTEGVRGNGDSLPWLRGEVQAGSRGRSGYARTEVRSGCGGRALPQKSSSRSWRQAEKSSTFVPGDFRSLRSRPRGRGPHANTTISVPTHERSQGFTV